MTPREILAIILAFGAASAMIWGAITPAAMAWLLSLPVPVLTGFSTLLVIASIFTARRSARR